MASYQSAAVRHQTRLVVDLAADASAGMATLLLCRRALPAVPVLVTASNPSLELTRSIRLSGAFCLALHPVESREMSTIIDSAFDALESRRASGSSTRRGVRAIDIHQHQFVIQPSVSHPKA